LAQLTYHIKCSIFWLYSFSMEG